MNTEYSEKNQEKSSEIGMYYRKSADKYGILTVLVLILLAVFAVLMIVFGHRSLRSVNLRYMTKYFDINPFTMDEKYHDIAYAVGGGSEFAFYHDDLAVLGEGKLALYDLAGDLVFRADIEKGTPSVEASGKYLAAFVAGKNTLTWFHSFGKAHETSFSSPISGVAVSENGITAVSFKGKDNDTIVIINDSFEEEAMLTSAKGIIMDMALSSDGKLLYTLSLVGSDGSYLTRLDAWDLKKNELAYTESFSGRKPLAVEVFSDGHFVILLDRLAVFYTENGKKKESVSFSSDIVRYHVSETRLLLLTSDRLMLLERDGKEKASISVGEHILEVKLSEDGICLLAENAVLCYDEKGELLSETAIPSGALELFALRDGSILLCYTSETKRIRTSKRN